MLTLKKKSKKESINTFHVILNKLGIHKAYITLNVVFFLVKIRAPIGLILEFGFYFAAILIRKLQELNK